MRVFGGRETHCSETDWTEKETNQGCGRGAAKSGVEVQLSALRAEAKGVVTCLLGSMLTSVHYKVTLLHNFGEALSYKTLLSQE